MATLLTYVIHKKLFVWVFKPFQTHKASLVIMHFVQVSWMYYLDVAFEALGFAQTVGHFSFGWHPELHGTWCYRKVFFQQRRSVGLPNQDSGPWGGPVGAQLTWMVSRPHHPRFSRPKYEAPDNSFKFIIIKNFTYDRKKYVYLCELHLDTFGWWFRGIISTWKRLGFKTLFEGNCVHFLL